MTYFELVGALVADAGVASEGVVERFDPFEDRGSQFGHGGLGAAVAEFDLHRSKERFHQRVVVSGGNFPDRSH